MAGKRKKRESNEGSWMDTYGDMVTLLLCFFVLLHSMSTISQQKWEILVKSFNPNAKELSQIVTGETQNDLENDVAGGFEDPGDTSIDNFDDLYYQIVQYVGEAGISADVDVTKGDGFTFITFKNNVFFDGDSYVLKEEGKVVLDHLATAIEGVKDEIEEIQVLGHTSQASPYEMNELYSDRFLSSNRADVVVVYLQQKNLIDPARLVSIGYGQFRPISSFDTMESRAKNRRVEILITKNNGVTRSLDEYYEAVYGDEAISQQ